VAYYREITRGQIGGDTELLHIGQAVLSLNGTMDYFIDRVFNYPTLAECY
jgi:NAD(P) transhydrogenase